MKNIFKIEDFEYDSHDFGEMGKFIRLEYAVNIANEKINKLIESWPVVYCNKGPGDAHSWSDNRNPLYSKETTHEARLAFIEVMKKESCKHEPRNDWYARSTNPCVYCGVELEPIWSEKK